MAFYHTVWPSWPSLGYLARNNRKFLLDRSVFDLVDAHQCLSLTDPKLLGWYLCLSPEDRRIIQDEGGFHYFLQRHPALEMYQHYVYIKHGILHVPHKTSHEHLKLVTPCVTERDHLEMDCTTYHTALSSPVPLEPTYQGVHAVRDSSYLGQQRPPLKQPSSSAAALCSDPAANRTYSEISPLQSKWAPAEKGLSSELCSFGSAERSDITISIQPAEIKPLSSPPDPVGQRQGDGVCGNQHAVDDEASRTLDRSDDFHSIMENDKSILACLTSGDVKALVGSETEAQAASSETAAQPVVNVNIPTCDATVGTEPADSAAALTQTEGPERADKHVITEVLMADLDYLAEEFINLSVAQEEVKKKQEEKKSRLGCKSGGECECVERAQRAELGLLALQYSMCRQHCWRLQRLCAEGGQPAQTPNIDRVLQQLESDYNQRKEKILAGVPLEQLHPLSVDPEKISSGGSYIPAQIMADVLGNAQHVDSQEPQKTGAAGVRNERTNDQRRPERHGKQTKTEVGKAKRAVALVPQERGSVRPPHKPEEKHSATCEVWYDAEEDLDPAEKAQTNATESANEEARSSEPASHVTELITSSVKNRKLVSSPPAAKGTCVLQHYGTMGSFDALMAELTQLHPGTARQRIVDALMQLRAEHQGVLGGLPLRTIREMTSELLSRSASAKQSGGSSVSCFV